MTIRPTNALVAKGIGTTNPNAKTWATFDRLPQPVRHLIWEAPNPINPTSAAELIEAGGEGYAMDALAAAIYQEVGRFASQHREAFGYQLPHVAALASMQAYGGRDGSGSKARRSKQTPPRALRAAARYQLHSDRGEARPQGVVIGKDTR